MKVADNVQNSDPEFSFPRRLGLCVAGAALQDSGEYHRKEDRSAVLIVFSAQRDTFPTGQVENTEARFANSSPQHGEAGRAPACGRRSAMAHSGLPAVRPSGILVTIASRSRSSLAVLILAGPNVTLSVRAPFFTTRAD